MKTYLDTNVYDYVAKSGQELAVRQFFDDVGIRVLVSGTNLTEIQATPVSVNSIGTRLTLEKGTTSSVLVGSLTFEKGTT